MPIFQSIVLPLILLWLAVACGPSSDKKDPLLLEAADYHNQAIGIMEVVEPQLDRIDSLKTVILASNTPAAKASVATLDSLKAAFSEWENNLVEVPGMPHDHSHEHGPHKHADATLNDLPANQMRDLQREMLSNIRRIQTRLDQVTKPQQ